MTHKMSHWLGKLRLCLDCQVENDNSSRLQKGPVRGLTPLGTPQQTEDGKQRRLKRHEKPLSPFQSPTVLTWCSPITYRLTTNTYATLTPSRLSFAKSHNQAHVGNTFQVPGMKRNDYFFRFLLSNRSCQEKFIISRKEGRWVREGEQSPKKGLKKERKEQNFDQASITKIF